MRKKLSVASLISLCALPALIPSDDASAIPAFARKYGTSCYTCHSGFPTRNAFGEAFRNNGYRWPGGEDEEKTKQEQLKLGSDGWKKTFPESPWPGEIPGYVPFSLWVRGPLVTYTQQTTTPTGALVAGKEQALNFGTGGLGSATLFFGGTMGDNLSAFGQYNLTNVATTVANTNTAVSGHVTWSFAPGVNLSFGNGFSDWTFGNALQYYNTAYPTPGTGAEFTYVTGQEGGFKITGGLAQLSGTAVTPSVKLDDIRYVRAKYKFGGAGLLSGAGGTYGNEFVGLDNHIAVGASYMSFRNNAIAAGNWLGETAVYGAAVTGNIGSVSLGATYSKDKDLKQENLRLDGNYFVFPWLAANLRYTSYRSADKTVNDPQIVAALTAHLRANAYVSATYTTHTKERLVNAANVAQNTLPSTFVVQGGFAF